MTDAEKVKLIEKALRGKAYSLKGFWLLVRHIIFPSQTPHVHLMWCNDQVEDLTEKIIKETL